MEHTLLAAGIKQTIKFKQEFLKLGGSKAIFWRFEKCNIEFLFNIIVFEEIHMVR